MEVKSWRIDAAKFRAALARAGIASPRDAYLRAGILSRYSGRWTCSPDTMARLAVVLGVEPTEIAATARGVGRSPVEESKRCPVRVEIPKDLRDAISTEAGKRGVPAVKLCRMILEEGIQCLSI
jgi:hypothetical protein